jgi:hypothetical protein
MVSVAVGVRAQETTALRTRSACVRIEKVKRKLELTSWWNGFQSLSSRYLLQGNVIVVATGFVGRVSLVHLPHNLELVWVQAMYACARPGVCVCVGEGQ